MNRKKIFLPNDLLMDVLPRLPIKTLVRLACVSKSWYSWLTNPSFITVHNLANNNNNLLLIRSRSGDDGKGVHFSLLRCENQMFYDYANLRLPLNSNNPSLRIIGICNGVVCLYSSFSRLVDWKELYLWNPSIRKTMALPPLQDPFRSHSPLMHRIGFGYDALTDDYKVVRIVYLYERITNGVRSPPEVDIFSLSTGTWRNISHLGLPHIIDESPQAYVNGAAHWLTHWINSVKLIVSFHMGDEVFGEIMVPGCIFVEEENGFNKKSNVRVVKFQESLSLIVGCNFKYNSSTLNIWVMKEYGISESWSKRFRIDWSGGRVSSVADFTRKGEVLFGTERGWLVAYDVEAKRHTKSRYLVAYDQIWNGHGDLWSRNCWPIDSFVADAYTESVVLLRTKAFDAVPPVSCKESPVLHGEASGAMTRKRRNEEQNQRRKGKNVKYAWKHI
ncbi:F-box protein At3g07870-like [Cornus florida]|uniref:F-box protein At3g07870-like n=1 Tax=Cornus florida TaxID=4283 RepID=UPI0028970683|nr:F-box protein At3g07870-like [Cornus florida]